jgi:hypothetical protein
MTQPDNPSTTWREVFILRLWLEKNDPTHWVGRVEHIGSRKAFAVYNFDQLIAHVQEILVQDAQAQTGQGSLK